jgi:hypothetical protein
MGGRRGIECELEDLATNHRALDVLALNPKTSSPRYRTSD